MTTIAGQDVPSRPSLLTPGQTTQEVAEEPPSPSDDPYQRNNSRHSRPLRKGTAIPPPGTNTATKGYPSTAEADGLHLRQGSMSSLHLSLHTVDNSVNNRVLLEDPLESRSHLSDHRLLRSHSRRQGHIDDIHSVTTSRTPSMRHLAPGIPDSRYASGSRVTLGSVHSLRSTAGSESRQAAYRIHKGPVNYRPGSIRSSVADLHHGSPDMVSAPLDLPMQAMPVTNPDIGHHVHYIAPPGSDERPGPEVVQYDGPPIAGMVAEDVRRYKRCNPRSPDIVSKKVVPGMTFRFPEHNMDVPEGWTTLVHPEGARYFLNQEKRTFTDMDICDGDICGDIEYYMQYLLDELRDVIRLRNLELDMQQIDLVLEPKVFDNDSVVCCYYFANHRDRCLFWLDDYHTQDLLNGCVGIENLSHIRFAIEGQYWRHWDYFPSLCLVTQNLIDEVKDMLAHVTCDHITSRQSSGIFDLVELKDHLQVVDALNVNPAIEQVRRCHAAIVIGRIMYSVNLNRFLNFHGEDCVRLTCEQTVHGWKYTPSWLMVALAPLLFLDPVTEIQELHKIFVDMTACKSRWGAFTAKLKEQLQDSNLLATVLLNANVGFLAINTVDKGGRSFVQLASYMSLVTSLGSIVLGLVFVSRDRTSGENTASETATYLSKLHHEKHGLEKLAIIYSLPKALLMWGMIFFFAAFSVNWGIPGDTVSRSIVGTLILIVFVMVSYGIGRSRDGDIWWGPEIKWPNRGIHTELLSHLSRAGEQFKELIRMQRGRRGPIGEPQSDTEGVGLSSMNAPASFSQANVEANSRNHSTSHLTHSPGFQPDGPVSVNHDNHSNPYISQSSAVVDSPLSHHDGISMLPASHSRPNPVLPSGLQLIQEDTPTISQDRPTAEPRHTPDVDHAPVYFTTSSQSASEGMVGSVVKARLHSDVLSTMATDTSDSPEQTEAIATDTGLLISSSQLCAEEKEYVKYMVEEPGELEDPQPSSSSTPPPRIFAKSATADYFHHATVAPKWTLQDGHDIEECKD
ncbi:hypothetical protein AZE42_04109 [Rhizopogon vesiculosus]|uniref:WW domain-containing protein n=1 Tax=Rhizopogon vesiculosus TaxID=180088 RepID=A0A1J8RIE2_9AGAM|nr:hypothetical protein AZE42_04109 [Rhizopogon vesiculosus]